VTSVFGHPWLGAYFGDVAAERIWSPAAELARLRAVEAAYTRALGAAGDVAPDVAEETAAAIEAAELLPEALSSGMAADGVPIPALVRALRAAAPEPEAVHTGMTSQDVLDTALAIALRETSDLLDARLAALDTALGTLAGRFGAAPLMGRTRMQAALPIAVSDRIATWRSPLALHRARLAEIRPRVELLQLGGPVGDGQSLGEHRGGIAREMAGALGLAVPPRAWHAMRDGLAEYAGLLSLVTGTLGKMGADLALMAQQGVEEVAFEGGGSSSAMPHKQNPVGAELLVTLARFNAVQVSGLHHALVHEQERSGAAWSLEWMVLPPMAIAAARALALGAETAARIARLGDPVG
jgi:3-carboxy-cis,cis-muconate cycloisomerase